jgi:phenylpyruvate tautomerase PptA (4-oxalocrotonate tautomerase family)
MPMHRIYIAEGLYTSTEKAALAKAITSLYSPILPAFYVVVLFVDLPKDSFFISGELNDKFVRFNVQHLARQFDANAKKLEFMKAYEQTLKPFTADKGLDWEVCYLSCYSNGLMLKVQITAFR